MSSVNYTIFIDDEQWNEIQRKVSDTENYVIRKREEAERLREEFKKREQELKILREQTKKTVGSAIAILQDGFEKAVSGLSTEARKALGKQALDTDAELAALKNDIRATAAETAKASARVNRISQGFTDVVDALVKQEKDDALIRGYFGKYAKCRNLTYEQIEENIKAGKPYVLRFRSDGSDDKRIIFDDMIRGKIEMPENTIDEVLLKSDGIPTYHFAHVCDDHFMRTTHVIRGEEWISSVPKHIALFKACGYKVPKYAHTPQLMKIDEQDGTKRKFSKRKDPEAAVKYFVDKGFPKESLIEYLLTLLNSNFEDWRRANEKADLFSFPFNLKKMSASGCLFDLMKLTNISKKVISTMSAKEIYSRLLEWAKVYDGEFYELLARDENYAVNILNIDRECPKPRKDIAKWDEVRDYVSYFYNEIYTPDLTLPENISKADAAAILSAYIKVVDCADDKDTWFGKMKEICEPLGFTPNVKEYKKNPEAYKGHVGDVSTVIRIALTSRQNTPDLHAIISLLGNDEVKARLNTAITEYNK